MAGRQATAGVQSALAKHNLQLPNDGAGGASGGRDRSSTRLRANALFQSAALPRRIVPPLFNRYDASDRHRFGDHVDNALSPLPGGGRIRTDLSATALPDRPGRL